MNTITAVNMRGVTDDTTRVEVSLTGRGDAMCIEIQDQDKRTLHTDRLTFEMAAGLARAILDMLPPTERERAPDATTVGGSSSVVVTGNSGGEGVR